MKKIITIILFSIFLLVLSVSAVECDSTLSSTHCNVTSDLVLTTGIYNVTIINIQSNVTLDGNGSTINGLFEESCSITLGNLEEVDLDGDEVSDFNFYVEEDQFIYTESSTIALNEGSNLDCSNANYTETMFNVNDYGGDIYFCVNSSDDTIVEVYLKEEWVDGESIYFMYDTDGDIDNEQICIMCFNSEIAINIEFDNVLINNLNINDYDVGINNIDYSGLTVLNTNFTDINYQMVKIKAESGVNISGVTLTNLRGINIGGIGYYGIEFWALAGNVNDIAMDNIFMNVTKYPLGFEPAEAYSPVNYTFTNVSVNDFSAFGVIHDHYHQAFVQIDSILNGEFTNIYLQNIAIRQHTHPVNITFDNLVINITENINTGTYAYLRNDITINNSKFIGLNYPSLAKLDGMLLRNGYQPFDSLVTYNERNEIIIENTEFSGSNYFTIEDSKGDDFTVEFINVTISDDPTLLTNSLDWMVQNKVDFTSLDVLLTPVGLFSPPDTTSDKDYIIPSGTSFGEFQVEMSDLIIDGTGSSISGFQVKGNNSYFEGIVNSGQTYINETAENTTLISMVFEGDVFDLGIDTNAFLNNFTNVTSNAGDYCQNTYSGTQAVECPSISSSVCPAVTPNEGNSPSAAYFTITYEVSADRGWNTVVGGSEISALSKTGVCGVPVMVDSTTANVTCTVSMDYYDAASIYSAGINVSDNITRNSTYFTGTSSQNCEYYQLLASNLATTNAEFSMDVGDVNRFSNNPIVVENTGNYDFTNAEITAYDLKGSTLPNNKLLATNFKINDAETISGALTLSNSTGVNLAVSLNAGSSANASIYLIGSYPVGQYPQGYYSDPVWELVLS